MDCGCSNCAALHRPLGRASLLLIHGLPYSFNYLPQHPNAVDFQGMAPTPLEAASGSINLIVKTKAALGASCDEAWCRQTISRLQLLEVVLSQVQGLSPTTADEETIRIVELCRLACAPFLQCFLQELEKLQPDLDHYFVAGEDSSRVGCPPAWATAVERITTTLMTHIGVQLQLTNALLQVESLRDHGTSGEIQRVLKIPSDSHSLEPATGAHSQQFTSSGSENVYQGIHIGDSARAHLGNSYSYLGVPKASVDIMTQKLNDLATSRQADALQSILQDMQKQQSDGCDVLSVIEARTQQVLGQLGQVADAIANKPLICPMDVKITRSQTTSQKRRKANLLKDLSCILEIFRIWLSTMIIMLLMGSRSFREFIRSTRTFIRAPSMLLNSNITLVDALNRELSLPYEHFRYWPVVLARLQCEFVGFPGESYIAKKKFGLFRAAKKPQNEVMIPFDQWERSVFPGNRILMSIDVDHFDPNECPSCGYALRGIPLMPVFSKWFVCNPSCCRDCH